MNFFKQNAVAMVALVIAIVGLGVSISILNSLNTLLHPHKSALTGSVSSQDITATNFTQVSASNGMFISAGGLTNTAGVYLNAGISLQTVKQALVAGTTTICAIQNPFNATSTIVSATMRMDVGSSTAITYAMGTTSAAVGAFGTTTSMISSLPVAAGGQGDMEWSAGVNNALIGPNRYFTIGSTAGDKSSFSAGITGISGTCTGTFQSLN